MVDTLFNNNKITVFRVVNSPVPSNTYLVVDNDTKECIIIDPGSKDSSEVKTHILSENYHPKYVILTHEHFDHCWSVNDYLDFPDVKIVASTQCAKWLKTPRNYFNKLYFDSDTPFFVEHVHVLVEEVGFQLSWGSCLISFIDAKGHTDKGICIEIDGCLFTGDTLLLRTKPHIKKRYGGSLCELKRTVSYLFGHYLSNTQVFPGHGEPFLLEEAKAYYIGYFNEQNNNDKL